MNNGFFSEFFGTIGMLDSIRVTLIMSFFSTLIASILGVTLAILLERSQFPLKKLKRIKKTR